MHDDPIKYRLLEAAGSEFAEKGYDGATVRSICRRAEMNVAAVNYHFGDKDRLYAEAVLDAHRCGKPPMPDDEPFGDGPPADRLRRFVRDFLANTLSGDGKGWREILMLREMTRPRDETLGLVVDVIRPRFERFLEILGELAPGADRRRLHALAFSVIGQCLHYRVGRPISERLVGPEAFAGLDVDYLADHITRFTLAGLGRGEPIGRAQSEEPR